MWKNSLSLFLVFALFFANGCRCHRCPVPAPVPGSNTYVRGELKRTYPIKVAPGARGQASPP